MKRFSMSLVIKELQSLLRWLFLKKKKERENYNCWGGYGETETLGQSWWERMM